MRSVNTLLPTAAGIFFLIVLALYDYLPIKLKQVLVITGAILDWLPILIGSMELIRLSILTMAHILLTGAAYILLILWFVKDSKERYAAFFTLWLISYAIGWLI